RQRRAAFPRGVRCTGLSRMRACAVIGKARLMPARGAPCWTRPCPTTSCSAALHPTTAPCPPASASASLHPTSR
ncbi:hypothetical protein M9458_027548, partial [Cirrhinus mrigala]